MIIGLSGYARVGKDEAAHALQTIHFTRVAFADKLREFLYRLNPVVVGKEGIIATTQLRYVIDRYGWDGYKETPWGDEIRGLLQRLGTECGRQLISDNVWVDAATWWLIEGSNYVFTDVRFPNEAQKIKDMGGMVVRIHRPGVGPANDHPSETALDDWPFDKVIYNNDSIARLHQKMYRLAEPYV